MSIFTIKIKKIILLVGDLIMLYFSLWLSVLLRSRLDFISSSANLKLSLSNPLFIAFSIIYLIWLVVFYIIGLYDLNIARNNLNFYTTLLKSISINTAIAISFFYFIPYFGITPKTILFIDIIVSSLIFIAWRQIYNRLLISDALFNNLLIIGETREINDITRYIEANPQLGFKIKKVVQPKEVELIFDLIDFIVKDKIQIIIVAGRDKELKDKLDDSNLKNDSNIIYSKNVKERNKLCMCKLRPQSAQLL